jgi:hypothetical protein
VFFGMCVIILILAIRGVFLSSKLKSEIGYSETSLSLYYLLQNQVIPLNDFPLELNTKEARSLFKRGVSNIRLSFLLIFVFVLVQFIRG